MGTFKIEVPMNDEEAMNKFQEFMNCVQDAWEQEAGEIAKEFNISIECAREVQYLRTRSRWTPEKEEYLIWLDQNGKERPDFNDDFDVPENYI